MENSTKNKKKKRGFTLVELVIVLAVMGIIALIAIPSLAGTKENFKIKADKKSCLTVKKAVEAAILDEDSIKEGKYYTVINSDKKVTSVKAIDAAGAAGAEQKILSAALQQTNAPQVKDGNMYLIEISGTGDDAKVSVMVVKETKDTEPLLGIVAK